MRFFIDTEFIESGPDKPIQLISIGIVSYLGAEFYAVSSEFDPTSASDWVKANVLPGVGSTRPMKRSEIAEAAREFVEQSGLRNSDGSLSSFNSKPEFWGYYADYDWVVFCQLFGAMIDLPKGWPMYCRDIKQWCDFLDNPKLPEQKTKEHNALHDARWNREAYEFLASIR
jgi:hypothetical protein